MLMLSFCLDAGCLNAVSPWVYTSLSIPLTSVNSKSVSLLEAVTGLESSWSLAVLRTAQGSGILSLAGPAGLLASSARGEIETSGAIGLNVDDLISEIRISGSTRPSTMYLEARANWLSLPTAWARIGEGETRRDGVPDGEGRGAP